MTVVKVYYGINVNGTQKVLEEDVTKTGIDWEDYGNDICLHLKYKKIPESGPRPKGIWSFDLDALYFTCPWCGGVNRAMENVLGESPSNCTDARKCLWCLKCDRHLWLKFLPAPIEPTASEVAPEAAPPEKKPKRRKKKVRR